MAESGFIDLRLQPLDDHWTVTGRSLDDHWTATGRLLDGYWTVTGRLLDGYWTVTGRSLDATGRPLDGHWTLLDVQRNPANIVESSRATDSWTPGGRVGQDRYIAALTGMGEVFHG